MGSISKPIDYKRSNPSYKDCEIIHLFNVGFSVCPINMVRCFCSSLMVRIPILDLKGFYTILDKHWVPSQNQLAIREVTHTSYKDCQVSLSFQSGILTKNK